jgi:hypothetical protein
MKVRYFIVPPEVSGYTTNESEPDRQIRYCFRRPVIDHLADIDLSVRSPLAGKRRALT